MNYIVTESTKEDVANFFGKEISELEEWEIGEMLDTLIDRALTELSPA